MANTAHVIFAVRKSMPGYASALVGVRLETQDLGPQWDTVEMVQVL